MLSIFSITLDVVDELSTPTERQASMNRIQRVLRRSTSRAYLTGTPSHWSEGGLIATSAECSGKA